MNQQDTQDEHVFYIKLGQGLTLKNLGSSLHIALLRSNRFSATLVITDPDTDLSIQLDQAYAYNMRPPA